LIVALFDRFERFRDPAVVLLDIAGITLAVIETVVALPVGLANRLVGTLIVALLGDRFERLDDTAAVLLDIAGITLAVIFKTIVALLTRFWARVCWTCRKSKAMVVSLPGYTHK
jgi:hypothetical protein